MTLRLLFVIGGLALIGLAAWWTMIRMPGRSFHGAPPALTSEETALRDELVASVNSLAGVIGERNLERYSALTAAEEFVTRTFTSAGLAVERDGYEVEGKFCRNIEAQIRGTRPEIIVVGAHYDTVAGSPGANDNASGVAALLSLARRFAGQPTARTLRFVAFPNEEPGHFHTHAMGSWVYAEQCQKRGDRIAGMISLETIGYYSSAAGSQKYPMPGLSMIYPTAGNFIAFVGNLGSHALLRKALGAFREQAAIPSEGAALPANIPGVGWSDHWAFWQHGYPAIMVTDTAPFRYPHYHAATDTPEKLDYDSMARVVMPMQAVIRALAND